MDYINRLLYFFKMSSEIETKLIDEPESLYRIAAEGAFGLQREMAMSVIAGFYVAGLRRQERHLRDPKLRLE